MSFKSQKQYTEQELWPAFRDGEERAFTQLFNNYVDAMFAYGKKITADSELVKDAIQDVFIKLHNNRTTLNDTKCIKGYLFVALKRTLINLFNDKIILSIDDHESVSFELELLSKESFLEENELYNEELKIQLDQALKELSPRQRESIYLYYIQEIPLTEIPELLGMNYQSTRNLLHRAMTKLRQCLGTASTSGSMSLLLLQYLSK